MSIQENRLVFREAPSAAPVQSSEKFEKTGGFEAYGKKHKQNGDGVAMDLTRKSSVANPAEVAKKNGYDSVGEYEKDGLAIAKKDDLFFLVDKDGKPKGGTYFEIKEYSDGMRWASGEDDNQWILLGSNGKEVGNKMYEDVRQFHEGKAGVKEGKWHFINKEGKDLKIGQFDEVYDFCNKVTAVRNAQYWKLIKDDGSKLNDKTYTAVDDDFDRGFTHAKRGNVWYKVDLNGKETVATKEELEE